MRTLQRYIFRELARVWLLAFAALTLVLTLAAGLQRLQRVGVSFSAVVKVLPLLMVLAFPYTVPVAGMLAAALAYGRLAADRELQAISSAGVHLGRLVVPAILLGLGLSLGTLTLTLVVIPQSEYQVSMALRQGIDELIKSLLDRRRDQISRFRFVFDEVRDGIMYGVVAYMYDRGEPTHMIVAKEARPQLEMERDRLVFYLKDGSITDLDSMDEVKFFGKPYEAAIPLHRLTRPRRLKEMSVQQLTGQLARLSGEERRKALTYLHGRYALGLAPFIFLLVGAPIGMVAKQAHMLGAFALCCLPVFLIYYPLMLGMKALSLQGLVCPPLGAWLPDLVLASIGVGILALICRR